MLIALSGLESALTVTKFRKNLLELKNFLKLLILIALLLPIQCFTLTTKEQNTPE